MITTQQRQWAMTAKAAAMAANHFHPGCAAAEACAETGWGLHMPPQSNNVLGIKPPHGWNGPVVDATGTEQNKDGSYTGPQDDLWAVFPNYQSCFEEQMSILHMAKDAHGNLLYAAALGATTPEDYISDECKVWSTSQEKTTTVLSIFHSHPDIFGTN